MISKLKLIPFVLLFLVVSFGSYAQANRTRSSIKHFVTENYINAAYNEMHLENLDKGFAATIELNGLSKGKWVKLSLSHWKDLIQNQLKDPNFGKQSRQFDFEFKHIGMSCKNEDCIANIELHLKQKGKVKFVDYLSLNTEKGDWQIIDKTFLMTE